jgi:hypothetical protein
MPGTANDEMPNVAVATAHLIAQTNHTNPSFLKTSTTILVYLDWKVKPSVPYENTL